jgi:serine/threonine-protein kinase
MALSTGTVLAGRYEITSPIATGGMGEVWRARDRVLDRVVAAKVLRSEFTGDPSFVARFRNEARHTAALSHPNIASVYDYGETEDERNPGQRLAFLVMELVEGQPLVTILHEEGHLPVDWTLHVLGQAADGLSAAHAAGVVHRDIKPGNLIVRPDGVVKLTDFGIARARDATPLTRTGMVVGTAQYLSPEQAQGFEVTAASDVYSLGVVGYECLTGSRPFDGTSQVAIALAHINRPPPPLPAEVPLAVRQLLTRSLEKRPEDRFDDGAAFAAAIRAVAAAVGSRAPAGTGLAAAAGATTQVVTMPAEPAPEEEPRTQVLDAAPAVAAIGLHTSARPMPPLAGPPADEDDRWDGDGTAAGPPPRRGRRWVWPVVALVVLALLLGLGWIVFSGGGGDGDSGRDRATTSASTSGSPSAATAAFDPTPLLGQDVDAAMAELQAQNFTAVRKQPASNEQLTDYGAELGVDEIAEVDPSTAGTIPLDQPITLYYAPDGYTPPEDEPTEDEPTTSAPATASTSAAAPSSSAPPSSPVTSSPPSSSATSSAPTSASGSTLPPPETSVEPPADAGAPVGAQGVAG